MVLKHSEEQIIGILKEAEKGLATAELCRQHGISEQTLKGIRLVVPESGGNDSRSEDLVAMIGVGAQ